MDEVGGRAHHSHAEIGSDADGNHVLGDRLAEPNANVEALGHNVGQTGVDGELDMDIRITLEQLSGLKLDLGNTEWHNLARAKDFFDKTRNARGFSEWRRDKQWLLQWLAPLQPFIAFPEVLDIGPQPVQQQDDGTKTNLDGVSHQRIVSYDDLVATPAEIGAGNSGGSKDPFRSISACPSMAQASSGLHFGRRQPT
jgi:hypothetical protein